MKSSRKAAVLLLYSLILIPAVLFGQDTATEELAPPVYVDILFNQYIELEDRILLDEIILEEEIYEIRKLRLIAEETNRKDIISRLDMLDYVVNTRLEEIRISAEAESITAKILSDEERSRQKSSQTAAGEAMTSVAIGTTLASAAVFLGSTLIYEDFYSKYTAAAYADQAAFYLFWWETCKTASIVSGWTTAAAALTSGLFTILF